MEEEDIGESPYCPVCESCGEEGCCSVENSLWKHDCKYGKVYARDVYQNEMIIDEFHKLLESMGICRDETGDTVSDPIGDLYERAYNRMKEKYKDE